MLPGGALHLRLANIFCTSTNSQGQLYHEFASVDETMQIAMVAIPKPLTCKS